MEKGPSQSVQCRTLQATCSQADLLALRLSSPTPSTHHVTRQGGNGAYGLKLDERLRITDSIKLRAAVGRLLTKMGTHYEPGTAVAADLKLRNPADDSARVCGGRGRGGRGEGERDSSLPHAHHTARNVAGASLPS